MELHRQLTLSPDVLRLQTKYKRSKIFRAVTCVMFTNVDILKDFLQLPMHSLAVSLGTLDPESRIKQDGKQVLQRAHGLCTTLSWRNLDQVPIIVVKKNRAVCARDVENHVGGL